MTITPDALRALIDAELPELIEIRHDLHAHPEVGYEEKRTSEVVQRELEAAGIDFARNLAGGTGVLGYLPGAGEQAIGLRADMDALPITEEATLPYKSCNPGFMHACGHDGHTTILLGAARVLARIAEQQPLPRPVTLLFQPAEEGGAGGRRMIEDGCLTGETIGQPIEHMFGLHGWPQLDLGLVATRVGPLLAAADMFNITITGTGGHAAFPHLVRDPIVAGSAMVTALQHLVSRNTDPVDASVISVTQFHAGTTHNIIENVATLAGTVRTLREDTRQMFKQRIPEVIDGIATAHGCTAEFEYVDGYPPTVNHADAVALFHEQATDAIGAERVIDVPAPFMGAEDFSFYGRHVPACFFILGLNPAGGTMPGLHQPTFDFNDEAIPLGIELFCRLALRP